MIFILIVYATLGACYKTADCLARPFTSAGGGYSKRQVYLSFTIVGQSGHLGRAHRSHRWGHWFESSTDHHSPSENTVFGRIFYAKNTKRNNNPAQIAKKERVFPSEFRDFSDFWHSYPAVTVYEVMNASADVDCPSDVIGKGGEGELGGDLFLALAEEITPVVVVLDGAEGMLAGLLAELLFGDVPLYENHDALVVAPELSEVVVMVGLVNVWDLLEGIAGITVHDNRDVGAVSADVDVLFPFGIGAAVGTGAAGFAAGILGAVFGIPLLEQLPPHGTGDPAVLMADEAADVAEGLNLYADVGALVAVRQCPGMETGLDILRLRRSLHLRGDILFHIVQREHALLPVLDEAHVRNDAVHEAVFDIGGALVALVAGAVSDIEVGDHVALRVHGGLDVVADLDTALLCGHHGGFTVGEGHGIAA